MGYPSSNFLIHFYHKEEPDGAQRIPDGAFELSRSSKRRVGDDEPLSDGKDTIPHQG